MKRIFALAGLLLLIMASIHAQQLNLNQTLRIDYIFSGDVQRREIAVSELNTFDGWYGRHVNLDTLALQGNGKIYLRDARTKRILYCNSFSTLFQEWLNTEEATRTRKAFENVFLLPMPTDSALVSIELYGNHNKLLVQYTHKINPKDILIRKINPAQIPPHKYILKSGTPEKCIDIAILAEGYRAEETDSFYHHAEIATEQLFLHEPFKSMKDRFNVVAVALPSLESGVSIPGKGEWKNTALKSHFDTFYSDRYLTTLDLKNLHNSLIGIPYEHFIILANTDNYGGGGIYNSYTLTTAKHKLFKPVIVHEFGHSFGGLSDEYYYDDQYTNYYYPDAEPWEQNLTTLNNFAAKWEDMLPAKTKIPTPPNLKKLDQIGVYEGGGYQSKGVYRAFQDCRMKTNECKAFCPVCQRALRRLIDYYTQEQRNGKN